MGQMAALHLLGKSYHFGQGWLVGLENVIALFCKLVVFHEKVIILCYPSAYGNLNFHFLSVVSGGHDLLLFYKAKPSWQQNELHIFNNPGILRCLNSSVARDNKWLLLLAQLQSQVVFQAVLHSSDCFNFCTTLASFCWVSVDRPGFSCSAWKSWLFDRYLIFYLFRSYVRKDYFY